MQWTYFCGSTIRWSQHLRRVPLDLLVLDQEAEEALERGDGARLARRGGAAARLVGEEAPQVRRTHGRPVRDPLALQEAHTRRHVALVGRAGERREPPLDPAVMGEVFEGSFHPGPSVRAGPDLGGA